MADEAVRRDSWRVIPDAAEAGSAERAEALVAELGLSRVRGDEPAEWSLRLDEGLWRLEDGEGRRLRIDFDAQGPDYRRRSPKGKGELIARALGAGKGVRRVLDLSAGLGQDAVFLSQLGFEVTAVERHPVLAKLLLEARGKTSRPELSSLRIVAGDSLRLLEDPAFTAGFEAAYFDPMYPSKKKSALPRQEMVLFRRLVGEDGDAAAVARAAREKLPRLVVKRPDEAPPLLEKPSASFAGTTVRYDVYLR